MTYYGVRGRLSRAIPKEVVWKMSKGVLICATANGCMLGWGGSKAGGALGNLREAVSPGLLTQLS